MHNKEISLSSINLAMDGDVIRHFDPTSVDELNVAVDVALKEGRAKEAVERRKSFVMLFVSWLAKNDSPPIRLRSGQARSTKKKLAHPSFALR